MGAREFRGKISRVSSPAEFEAVLESYFPAHVSPRHATSSKLRRELRGFVAPTCDYPAALFSTF